MENHILLVDDNPSMIQLMGRILRGQGQLRFATSGAAALQQATDYPTDLILLDAEMPGMSGYQVCEALKANPALCDIPVIFVTGHTAPEFELKGLSVGAVDFIHKPISEPLLLARVATQLRVKRLTDELRRIAAIDPLTQVANRRSFDSTLACEWKRGLRNGHPISLLMVDVDHFKLFNDHYGHPAGDDCLRSLGATLRSACLRPADLAARWGGEEFALLLPQTPRAGAELVAQRIQEAVAALATPHAASPTAPRVTVSIGVGVYDCDSPCWVEPSSDSRAMGEMPLGAHALLLCADRALYAAKANGRAQTWLLDIANTDHPGLARRAVPRQLLHSQLKVA